MQVDACGFPHWGLPQHRSSSLPSLAGAHSKHSDPLSFVGRLPSVSLSAPSARPTTHTLLSRLPPGLPPGLPPDFTCLAASAPSLPLFRRQGSLRDRPRPPPSPASAPEQPQATKAGHHTSRRSKANKVVSLPGSGAEAARGPKSLLERAVAPGGLVG